MILEQFKTMFYYLEVLLKLPDLQVNASTAKNIIDLISDVSLQTVAAQEHQEVVRA